MKTIPELKAEIINDLKNKIKISEEFCYKVTLLLYQLYHSKMKLMNEEELQGLDFSYGYCYLLYDISILLYRDPTNSVVNFIKKYGEFNGRYYSSDDEVTTDDTKYLFPKGKIEPRFNFLKNAIENYQTSMGIGEQSKLTKKEQIACLISAKEYTERNYLRSNGICLALRMPISQRVGKFIDYEKCNEYIPLFTFENAENFCRKSHYKMPNNYWYWWDRSNVKVRIAFINWMIRELKK